MFQNRLIKPFVTLIAVLPFAFLLTQCAEDFDNPPKTKVVKVEVVASGLNKPFDMAIVPEAAAAAKPGQTLHHNDLLVANFGDNTISQIDESVDPAVVRLFADQTDTTGSDLNQPTGIAFETASGRGDVYISNFLNGDGTPGGAVTVFNKDGSFNRVIDHATLFNGARGIAYDVKHSTATQAVFFVSNLNDSTILKIVVDLTTPATPVDVVSLYADLKPLGLRGKNPTQLAISPTSPYNLYAANTGIRPPLPDGDAQAPVGSTISIIPTTATATVPVAEIRLILAGEVTGPLPLDFDDEGRLFTSDHAKGTLVMIDPLIGVRLASVETGEANMYGMAVGEGGVYLTAVKGGRILEVETKLLTGESGGHHE